MSKKRRNISWCGPVEEQNQFHIVPCKALFFSSLNFPLYFSFIYMPLNVTHRSAPVSPHWPEGQVSLIWSARRHLHVTSGRCEPARLETPPPLVRTHEWRKKKDPSTGFMLGREWRRDIWPHLLLHGTHKSDVYSLSLVITEQDIKTHQLKKKKGMKMKQKWKH